MASIHPPSMITWAFFISIMSGDLASGRILPSTFSEGYVCKSFQYLTDNGHLESHQTITSGIQCAGLCGQNDMCLGTLKDVQGSCNLLKYSHDIMDIMEPYCEKSQKQESTQKRRCWTGSQPSTEWPKVCDCPQVRRGLFCHRFPRSCHELKDNGLTVKSIYMLELGFQDYPVECSFGSVVKAHVMKSKGALDQRLSWQQYVHGYRLDQDHFFVGLEPLHWLMGHNFTYLNFKTVLKNFTATTGITHGLYVWYFNLTVSNASSDYRLTYDDYSENIRNNYIFDNTNVRPCMTLSQGARFSTWDRDNDGDDSKNCAAFAQAGWWFNGCDPLTYCNPFGRTAANLPENATSGYVGYPDLNLSEPPMSTWGFQVVVNLAGNTP